METVASAIGLGASLLTLTDVVLRSFETINEVRRRCKDPQGDIKQLSSRLKALHALLSSLGSDFRVTNDKISPEIHELWQATTEDLASDVQCLATLTEGMERKLNDDPKSIEHLRAALRMWRKSDQISQLDKKFSHHVGFLTLIQGKIILEHQLNTSQLILHCNTSNEQGYGAMQEHLQNIWDLQRQSHSSQESVLHQLASIERRLSLHCQSVDHSHKSGCARSCQSRPKQIHAPLLVRLDCRMCLSWLGHIRRVDKEAQRTATEASGGELGCSITTYSFVPPAWISEKGFFLQIEHHHCSNHENPRLALRPFTINRDPLVVESLIHFDSTNLERAFNYGQVHSQDYVLCPTDCIAMNLIEFLLSRTSRGGYTNLDGSSFRMVENPSLMSENRAKCLVILLRRNATVNPEDFCRYLSKMPPPQVLEDEDKPIETAFDAFLDRDEVYEGLDKNFNPTLCYSSAQTYFNYVCLDESSFLGPIMMHQSLETTYSFVLHHADLLLDHSSLIDLALLAILVSVDEPFKKSLTNVLASYRSYSTTPALRYMDNLVRNLADCLVDPKRKDVLARIMVRIGRIDMLQHLLPLCTKCPWTRNLIGIATAYENVTSFDFLLDAGLRPSLKDHIVWPRCETCSTWQYIFLRTLEQAPSRPNPWTDDSFGICPLLESMGDPISKSHPDVVRMLLSKNQYNKNCLRADARICSSSDQPPDQSRNCVVRTGHHPENCSAVFAAIVSHDEHALTLFVNEGVSFNHHIGCIYPHLFHSKDKDIATSIWLTMAVRYGNPSMVHFLLKNGADASLCEINGKSAMKLANEYSLKAHPRRIETPFRRCAMYLSYAARNLRVARVSPFCKNLPQCQLCERHECEDHFVPLDDDLEIKALIDQAHAMRNVVPQACPDVSQPRTAHASHAKEPASWVNRLSSRKIYSWVSSRCTAWMKVSLRECCIAGAMYIFFYCALAVYGIIVLDRWIARAPRMPRVVLLAVAIALLVIFN